MDEHESPDPPELHDAAAFGLPLNVVRDRIRAVDDVDALWWGRTALFEAVMNREHEIAVQLVSAGADPWRAQMAGWSPGRLNLAGPEPELFGAVPPSVSLTDQEQAAVDRSGRLVEALSGVEFDGFSIACIAGVDVAEASRRLQGRPIDFDDFDEWLEGLWDLDEDEMTYTVGVTDVPGGCVVTQWSFYAASTPGLMGRLTAGTVGYGMYANPKSGNQGTLFRDGVMLDHDQHPGGAQAAPDDPSDEVLRTYLYAHHAIAYCCDAAGLEPVDDRALTGPPDVLLRLPALELWPGQP